MRFIETALPGAYIVDLEERADERGFFARGFCAREFEAHGLTPRVVQANFSFNRVAGTLRGLHYQTGPAAEAKLIRCIGGEAYFAVVDLRPGPGRLEPRPPSCGGATGAASTFPRAARWACRRRSPTRSCSTR